MNPWELVWIILGWVFLVLVVLAVLIIVAGAVYGVIRSIRKSKAERSVVQGLIHSSGVRLKTRKKKPRSTNEVRTMIPHVANIKYFLEKPEREAFKEGALWALSGVDGND